MSLNRINSVVSRLSILLLAVSLAGCGSEGPTMLPADVEGYAADLAAALNASDELPGTFTVIEARDEDEDGHTVGYVTLAYAEDGPPAFKCKIDLVQGYSGRNWMLYKERRLMYDFETPGFQGGIPQRNELTDDRTQAIRRVIDKLQPIVSPE